MGKIVLVFITLMSFWVEANLVIHPIRVQFNAGDRSSEVTLLNDSKTTNTYRLEWREKKAIAEGGYIDLTADTLNNFPIASSMVRFTPRQVTLKPGERQTIKLSLRKPARLPEGEYRSHLIFKAVPPPALLRAPDEQVAGLTMSLNLVTSFVIPVVLQNGKNDANVRLDSASIIFDAASPGKSSVVVNLSRMGRYSTFGDLEAYWTPNGGSERLIAKASSFTFWPELSKANRSLTWVGADFARTSGKLRILYKGARDFQGQTFFDSSVQVDGSAIKMNN